MNLNAYDVTVCQIWFEFYQINFRDMEPITNNVISLILLYYWSNILTNKG